MSSNTEEEQLAVEVEGEEKVVSAQPQEAGATALDADRPANPQEAGPSTTDDGLAVLQGEVAKWKDLALRSQAELDNFRKRMAREKADAIRFGNAALLESLLPVVDNFRFGLEAAKREAGASVVLDGMSMVYKQLNDFLEEFGVQEVEAEKKPFDPNVHEAVQQEFSQEVEEGYVLSVVRRGFRLHDRLLRPANVVVSRGPAKDPGAAPEQAADSEGLEPSPNQ